MGERCICVYSASGDPANPAYAEEARALGFGLAERGYCLCFGGGTRGLMGITARAARQVPGTRVIGVIPRALNRPGIAYEDCDELIVTETLRERKQVMDDLSMAFVALPGGYGTMEELLEIITLKQLGYHNKPVALINTAGYYGALLTQFERGIRDGMAGAYARGLYRAADTAAAALDYIDGYKPERIEDKFSAARRGDGNGN